MLLLGMQTVIYTCKELLLAVYFLKAVCDNVSEKSLYYWLRTNCAFKY